MCVYCCTLHMWSVLQVLVHVLCFRPSSAPLPPHDGNVLGTGASQQHKKASSPVPWAPFGRRKKKRHPPSSGCHCYLEKNQPHRCVSRNLLVGVSRGVGMSMAMGTCIGGCASMRTSMGRRVGMGGGTGA